MDRVAIFVDVGYLFAQGGSLLSGQKLARSEVNLNYDRIVDCFGRFAEIVSGLKLLRVYWYDGSSGAPTPQHLSIAHLPGVKLRLGYVNSSGQQKGVDSLIITDMITLARNRAMADVILLSGDEDLRVGVQHAQELGVRVHLLGIKPSRGTQSLFLLQEADSTHEWAEDDVRELLSIQPRAAAPQTPAPPAKPGGERWEDQLRTIAIAVAAEVSTSDLPALVDELRANDHIPRELDGRLLARGRDALKIELDGVQKKFIRRAFRQSCEERASPSDSTPV